MPDDMSAEVPKGVTTITRPPEFSRPTVAGMPGAEVKVEVASRPVERTPVSKLEVPPTVIPQPELAEVREVVAAEARREGAKRKVRINVTEEIPWPPEQTVMAMGLIPIDFSKVSRLLGEAVKGLGRRGERLKNAATATAQRARQVDYGNLAERFIVWWFESNLERQRWTTEALKKTISTTNLSGEIYFQLKSWPSRAWESLSPVVWYKEHIARPLEKIVIKNLKPPELSQLAMDTFRRRNGLQDWNEDDLKTLKDKWEDTRAIIGINQANERLAWRKDTIRNLNRALGIMKRKSYMLGVPHCKPGETKVLPDNEQEKVLLRLLNLYNITDAAYVLRRMASKRISFKVTNDGFNNAEQAMMISRGADAELRASIDYLDKLHVAPGITTSPGKGGGWTLTINDIDASLQAAEDFIRARKGGTDSRAPVPG